MSDLLEDDLEFRGGTLQLSTDPNAEDPAGSSENNTAADPKSKPSSNVNPSILSGADSLSSSTSSFAGEC